MARNVYFNDKVRSEQNLFEDIVIESLKIYGQDVYYLPRDLVAEDKILTVAPLSTEATIMYQFFVKQELGPAKKKVNPMTPDVVSEPSELNYKQGYIGTVEEARKKLEDLFKS